MLHIRSYRCPDGHGIPLAPARADEAPASKWGGSAGVVNDSLFRGISQTDRRPAVQAGAQFAPQRC